jgi:ribosomal protein L24
MEVKMALKKGDEVVIQGGPHHGLVGKLKDDPAKHQMVTVDTVARGPIHGLLPKNLRKM